MSTATADFVCSKCKKGYAWYADYAGKVARCTCGAVIQFPFTDPKPKDPLAIPFLPRNVEEQSGNQGPAPMELPKEDLDPKILAERRALGEYFDDAPVQIDPVRDVHAPFALLAIGLLLFGWHVADVAEAAPVSAALIASVFAGVIALEVFLELLGVIVAGKLMGIYFGKFKLALFKLGAIILAPTMINSMVSMGMGDDAVAKVVGTGAAILLYWGAFTLLFRIKAWQTLVCVACICMVSYGIGFCIGLLVMIATGHAIR